MTDSSEHIDPDKHGKAEFLFPETTRDFDKLPLEFKVLSFSCVHEEELCGLSARLLTKRRLVHFFFTSESFSSSFFPGILWLYSSSA